MSELFSEVYNCYFQVIKSLIEQKRDISERELNYRIRSSCFEESILYLLPKLTKKGWGFYEQKDGVLHSRLSEDFYVPLTDLQKSYLKTILSDEKIGLFLDEEEIAQINASLSDVDPLFVPEDFYYYDRFADKDDYCNPDYKKHFRTILSAIQNRAYIDIIYESRHHRRLHHKYLPCRLEYSIKNDCFRLLAVESRAHRSQRVITLNLDRIVSVMSTSVTVHKLPDISRLYKRSCYHEPVRVLIKNRRNALERAMLQFANYEKSTRRLNEDTYECLIYYNKETETELLIEILSFGPMVKVVGNETFLRLIKERLIAQNHRTSSSTSY
ncbi:MAG: WYL domain-containing protein [Lachnospiraceae bacterium]|nr:WYL domain-containing protein [Lachnospiraceae bacterium]